MLQKLTVKNYAIIESVEIKFSAGMNVITGETGAGKSILVGALSLILGERADTRVLHTHNDKCVLEAEFELKEKALEPFFSSNELDFEKHTIIRREINQSGKSRAFVNDTPVTLNQLKELGEKLVNLHNQHETLDLVKAGFQMQVIDALAGNHELLDTYQETFGNYKKQSLKLELLTREMQNASAELDYLQFQLNEFAEAQLQPGEEDTLEAEQKKLTNVEEIKSALQTAVGIIGGSEMPVLDRLSDSILSLKNAKNFNPEIQSIFERLQSVYTELKDISNELERVQEDTILDPEKLEEITQRLNTIYRLMKKHNVTSINELVKIQEDLEKRIFSVDTNSIEIEKLRGEQQKLFKSLVEMADKLHKEREKVLRNFQTNVIVLLAKVGMPNASFKVDIRKAESHLLNETGLTELKFLFSANKGYPVQEIADVASGGELSRLMLCVKSLVADAAALATLIFDEIDSGISGEVALKVGEIMKRLTRNHQLICITHLPQIARAADAHYYVYKENKNHRTQTLIKELNGEERVIEIAKMLSGNKVSEASIANAKELMALG